MNKFKIACEMSFNDWVATIPDDVPEAEYTDKHEKWLKILFNKMRGNRYHTFTTKTVKVLVLAAVVSAFFLTAFAVPSSREFIIENFDIFSSYTISEPNDNSVNDEITVGYIPEGFELKETCVDKKGIMYKYISPTNRYFRILKNSSSSKVDINNEILYYETVVLGSNTYYYYLNETDTSYIIWNKNDYVYQVFGNISKEELLNIAENIK